MIKVLLLMLLPALAAAQAPPAIDNRAVTGVVRVFHSVNENLRAVVESSYTAQNAQEREARLMAGPRWRVLRWLNLAAYWEIGLGTRNNNDWIRNPQWFWQDSRNRSEHSLIGEATARALIPFDFVGNTFVELRSRWQSNLTQKEQTAFVRPGIFHTLTKHGAPRLTLSVTHELELPIDWGERNVSGSWTWFGTLWHFNSSVAAGPFLGLGTRWWTTSLDARTRNVASYSVAQKETIYGLQLNIYDF